MAIGAGLTAGALLGAKAAGIGALGKSALLAGGGTAIGALPDIIPSRFERDQKKRLREMQRKQELGALGLTDRERASIEGQMRGARQQSQQYAQAERQRLAQPSAQPQMALLGQQMQDESRQRLEADLASQILGMDLARQAQQEQEIKDLQAAQAQYQRARVEGLTAPFQSAAEAATSQMGLEQLLNMQQANQGTVDTPIPARDRLTSDILKTAQGQNYLQSVVAPSLGLGQQDLMLFGAPQTQISNPQAAAAESLIAQYLMGGM